MLTLLNSPVLTNDGTYQYRTITSDHARQLVANRPWFSAIGHVAAAEVISTELGIDCPLNRIDWRQNVGDVALVFKLQRRAPKVGDLSQAETMNAGFEWGLLERLA